MKAYEFPATITANGELELPMAVAELLPANQPVRVIVLVPEPVSNDADVLSEEEEEGWARFGTQQLARFYGEADEIYDRL